jgi:hypothetical protein
MQLPIAAKALAAQLAAVAAGWLLLRLAASLDVAVAGAGLMVAIGGAAVLFSAALRLPTWWLPIQAVFVPGLVWAADLELPPELFLWLLLALLLVYPSNFKERVPLYLSNRATWDAVLTLLPQGSPFTLVDLGCGSGGGLVHLAKRRPLGRFVGVETAPLPFLLAWLRARGLGNCRVRLGSLWQEDLSGYQVVYAFLSPAPMARLWSKVRREMGPGSLFISNSFEVSGEEPDAVMEVDDARHTRLLIWRF